MNKQKPIVDVTTADGKVRIYNSTSMNLKSFFDLDKVDFTKPELELLYEEVKK